MSDRFRDLAAIYGDATALLAEQQRLDRLAFSGADLVERVGRNALDGHWADLLKPDPADHLGVRDQLFASERLVVGMECLGLVGLSDRDLATRFGVDVFQHLTSTPFRSALDELCYVASSRFAEEASRQTWMENLLPSVDRLTDLAHSVITERAFDVCTEQILEGIVGIRSDDALDALSRATSLRLRRSLYRELGADRWLEHVPRPVIDLALRGEPEQDTEHQPMLLVALHLSHHRLSGDHTRCYELLGCLELFLRDYVVQMMRAKYGPDWFESVPPGKRAAWKRTFTRHYGDRSVETLRLLSSSDFVDLIDLIAAEVDHSAVDMPALLRCLQDVRMTRNAVMHFHAIVGADYVALYRSVEEILKALRLGSPDPENSRDDLRN